MIKTKYYRISRKTILSCIVIAAVAISNCSVVRALDTKNVMEVTTSNEVNINGENKFLIDAPLKYYDDINKAENAAGFKFKVPDFIPAGNNLEGFHVRKITDTGNDNAVQIYFEGENQVPFDITFQVSKTNHTEALEKIETEKIGTTNKPQVETKEEAMKLGGVSGKSITLSINLPPRTLKDGTLTEELTEVYKYFVWENDGLNYSIKYNSIVKIGDKTSKQNLNLSEDIIEKIAESIKYPEEVKGVDYSLPKRELSTEVAVLDIYDKDDLENAEKLLGFNPKFPLKINEDIKIKGSNVGISYVSDIKNNKISYELNSFYSNKDGSITFWEGRSSKEYDEIEKSGYISEKNWKTNEDFKIKAEKLNVDNKEVFKYGESGIEGEQEGYIAYLWKEDGIYYSVTFFNNAGNTDEIAKAFVNSKPRD